MKTAVSVPNELFQRADRLAHETGRSRSEVYSAALRDYVAKHEPDDVTEALDRTVAALGHPKSDSIVRAAARRMLGRADW